MKVNKSGNPSGKTREAQHAELLEAALAKPGIREVMQVYGRWRDADRRLYIYRLATTTPEEFATTHSSNIAGSPA